ncbi:MAG: TraR/DksA C4-type zinc finger protein [Sulfuricurvum sp.]|uniref:TraR/DksA family transcriptional regulator n=1 Tax=Sulfuricurvum sp. TaxID=2025608 RepID=UPI0025E5E174|nr:TraR/DksA C4-type zinc finger protein [Sulfuricurvum sp.]MCK9373278.1 TraR/DksA C4-type zinc finger protein [Sulfuricurvum sp.]
MAPRTDLDIKEFATLLQTEKERIQKNIEALKTEVHSIGSENDVGDDEDLSERQIDNTNDQALLNRLNTEMQEIEAALGRIHSGTYGLCEKTGEPIPLKRLRAYPSARTVVGA